MNSAGVAWHLVSQAMKMSFLRSVHAPHWACGAWFSGSCAWQLRERYAAYLVPGFINGMPEELIVPMDDWIISNGLQGIYPAFYFASGTKRVPW